MKKTTIIIACSVLTLITAVTFIYTKKDTESETDVPVVTTEPTYQIDRSRPSPSMSTDDDDAVLPEAIQEIPKPREMTLWDSNSIEADIEVDGIPAKRLQVNPTQLDYFHVGQNVKFTIPQLDRELESEIESTSNQMDTVKVWKGKIKDAGPQDNIIVTQGSIETHIIVSTFEVTYSTIIDNKTGRATLVDEADIVAGQAPFDDGIPVEIPEDAPPVAMQ